MKQFVLQVILVLIVIFAAFAITTRPEWLNWVMTNIAGLSGTKPAELKTQDLSVGEAKFKVEVADDKLSRSKGLAGREFLSDEQGMLFTFDNVDNHRFWMKGMLIALDFIYIQDGKVVEILEGAEPPSPGTKDEDLVIYQPNIPVNQVLEVASGVVSRKGIKVGDDVR